LPTDIANGSSLQLLTLQSSSFDPTSRMSMNGDYQSVRICRLCLIRRNCPAVHSRGEKWHEVHIINRTSAVYFYYRCTQAYPPGFGASWSVAEIADCTLSPPGTYTNVSASSTCESCLASKFQDINGLPVARCAFRIRLLHPGVVRAIARLATFADAAQGYGACPDTLRASLLAGSADRRKCCHCISGYVGDAVVRCESCPPGGHAECLPFRNLC